MRGDHDCAGYLRLFHSRNAGSSGAIGCRPGWYDEAVIVRCTEERPAAPADRSTRGPLIALVADESGRDTSIAVPQPPVNIRSIRFVGRGGILKGISVHAGITVSSGASATLACCFVCAHPGVSHV